jgi:hypothetical protein
VLEQEAIDGGHGKEGARAGSGSDSVASDKAAFRLRTRIRRARRIDAPGVAHGTHRTHGKIES